VFLVPVRRERQGTRYENHDARKRPTTNHDYDDHDENPFLMRPMMTTYLISDSAVAECEKQIERVCDMGFPDIHSSLSLSVAFAN
jgi:hypothetical protein